MGKQLSMLKKLFTFYILFSLLNTTLLAQKQSSEKIKQLVEAYKNDIRGPYYRIKWFCKDGSIRNPKNPCPDAIGGGIQHASFKESALQLRKDNHLYFGEILASNTIDDFLDQKHNFSRVKQYQINNYLKSIDNGWVLQKGQY